MSAAAAMSGKVLPHSLDAEKSLLGAVLTDGRCFADVVAAVDARDFYSPVHEAIFGVMRALDAQGKPIDPLTVASILVPSGKLRGVGGSVYLVELQAEIVTVANVGYYAHMVRMLARRREWIHRLGELQAKGYDLATGTEDYLAECEAALTAIPDAHDAGKARPIKVALGEFQRALEERHAARSAVTGIPSGLAVLDAMTAGFQPTHFVVLAGRPGMGKTALALRFLEGATGAGVPGLVFSLEMSGLELSERMVASEGRVHAERLRDGALERAAWVGVSRGMSRLATCPLWLYDAGAPTVAQIRSVARRWRLNPSEGGAHKHALVVVDHVGLVTPAIVKGVNREQQVAAISNALRVLAKELNCTVLAISQLSRDCEKRPDKRPMKSDLRDSGTLEQDAHDILFLYRDEEYHPVTAKTLAEGAPDNRGVAEVIVAKQRSGRTGTVRVCWLPEITRFDNLEERR